MIVPAGLSVPAESKDFLVCLRLRRALRRLRQRTHNRAARQFDLEIVMSVTFGATQRCVGSLLEARLRCRLSAQCRFGGPVAPRLMRDSAKRQTRLLDAAAVEFEHRRNRHQREGAGEAGTYREI